MDQLTVSSFHAVGTYVCVVARIMKKKTLKTIDQIVRIEPQFSPADLAGFNTSDPVARSIFEQLFPWYTYDGEKVTLVETKKEWDS